MTIVRVTDDEGYEISDYDFRFVGKANDPNMLPPDSVKDRQRNTRARNTMTFLIDHALMCGAPEITKKVGKNIKRIRPALSGVGEIGIRIDPRPVDGFVHYRPALLTANSKNIDLLFLKNGTTMLDIVLKRIVHRGIFELTTSFAHEPFETQSEDGIIG